MSGFTPAPPSASASGDRVILRIGGRSRPGSSHAPLAAYSLQPQQPTEPHQAYSRPSSSVAYQQAAPVYQAYQPPARSDSTHSLPASNDIYTITRGPSSSAQPGLMHSSSVASTKYSVGAGRPDHTQSTTQQGRAMSRATSSAALPLAVAIGSDSFNMPSSSSLSPSNSTSLAPSRSQEVISVPSVLSPSHRISVPLIKWAEVAPPEQSVDKNSAMKSEFHSNLKSFLKVAKQNIEELTMELFYEEDESDSDDEEDGAGPKTKRTAPSGPSQQLVTPASLTSGNAKQLGSPRKTALLQQLVTLSAHMDEGLTSIQAAKEAALRRAKEGHKATHAPKFNKNDIAQLASLARDDAKGTNAPGTLAGKYPSDIGPDSQAALAAFVRRSQLGERHRAYEQWVAGKAAAQEKTLAKAAREEKLARLREVQARAHQAQQSKAEAERFALEEAQLRREMEAQRLQEEAEERARLETEARERERLESERRDREEARRLEREAEAQRQKFAEEMLARATEERAWQREKAARDLAEQEALRLAEELQREVARDLAMLTASKEDQEGEAQDARDEAELDALFAEATLGGGGSNGAQRGLPGVGEDDEPAAYDDVDTDEEYAEFNSPTAAARTQARTAARGSQSSRGPAPLPPTAPTGALAGRKGRTVARTAASSSAGFAMPHFPGPPALPSSVASGKPPAYKPMSFGGALEPATSSTNYRFERAKRMHGR